MVEGSFPDMSSGIRSGLNSRKRCVEEEEVDEKEEVVKKGWMRELSEGGGRGKAVYREEQNDIG